MRSQSHPMKSRAKIVIASRAGEDVPEQLWCDSSRLLQILVNLVDNAIKYSPENGRVKFSAAQRGSSVSIQVQDWGSGIPQEHLPRLFERFYRADKARSRELGGTGLGLAVVHQIVEQHRGRIEVDSETGRGTCVELIFPENGRTDVNQ